MLYKEFSFKQLMENSLTARGKSFRSFVCKGFSFENFFTKAFFFRVLKEIPLYESNE